MCVSFAPAMNAVIETRVGPQMDHLLTRLITEGRDMTLDGVKVFEAKDKFLPGKIAVGAYVKEAAHHKRASNIRGLRGAMFQQQPTAVLQVRRRRLHDLAQACKRIPTW